MRRWKPPQPNLFEPTPPCGDLPLPQRVKALELLKALLREAMLDPVVEIDVTAREGAGDDQDHA
jgi:hypothetical protein